MRRAGPGSRVACGGAPRTVSHLLDAAAAPFQRCVRRMRGALCCSRCYRSRSRSRAVGVSDVRNAARPGVPSRMRWVRAVLRLCCGGGARAPAVPRLQDAPAGGVLRRCVRWVRRSPSSRRHRHRQCPHRCLGAVVVPNLWHRAAARGECVRRLRCFAARAV